jgi:predicted transposase YbfD/YdcC
MFRELLSSFSSIEDPRESKKREHLLLDVLAISVCAALAHAESFEDVALYGRSKRAWLSRFLSLPNGIPSHDTFRRVFMPIDVKSFERCFLDWTRAAFREEEGAEGLRHVAVDGKTMRRSFDRRAGRSPLHVVSAFATRSGLTLAQRVVSDKSGELSVLPDLLDGLDLAGSLISLDALACRKEVASAIVDGGGDYLLALKANQKKAHASARDWFDENAFSLGGGLRPALDSFDGSHGRLTRRRAFVSGAADLIEAVGAWPGLKKVLAVETIRSVDNAPQGGAREARSEIRYCLTSAEADDATLAAAVRNHWAVENGLHWVLDVGFREDECRVRNRNAAGNLAVLRKIAVNLVKADVSRKGSIKGKRKAARWDDDFMQKIVAA